MQSKSITAIIRRATCIYPPSQPANPPGHTTTQSPRFLTVGK